MRLLLDTHVLIALTTRTVAARFPHIDRLIRDPANRVFVSVASLLEVAIKTRLGKLDPGMSLDDLVGYCQACGLGLIAIDHRHVLVAIEPLPTTKDPFDRLLLAQCRVEDMRLGTQDHALVGHPLALSS
jgi:PIN domain nuclease of toxin-antitoxin system